MDVINQPGYYSLIQYCPDSTRLETVNLGVVLLCPADQFIEARTVNSLARVKRLFAVPELDEDRLRASLQALQERINRLWGEVRSADDLLHFAQTRANDLVLTPPRPLKVASPREGIDALYAELFGPAQRQRRQRAPEIPALDAIFRRATVVQRVQFDVTVEIPVLGQVLKAPYAFQNGVYNLVRPETLAGATGATLNRVERLAVEGNLLYRHPGADGRQRQLVVVLGAADAEAPGDLRQRIAGLFQEYDVRVVQPAGLEAFGREVETTAH